VNNRQTNNYSERVNINSHAPSSVFSTLALAQGHSRIFEQHVLTLILQTWTKWRAPTNASKWRMVLNSAFKGLNKADNEISPAHHRRKTGLYNLLVLHSNPRACYTGSVTGVIAKMSEQVH
jgi:hypothetical protein